MVAYRRPLGLKILPREKGSESLQIGRNDRAAAVVSWVMERVSGGLPGATLRRVLEHIDANVHRDPRLAELSTIAHMSVFHFARLFKLSTGLPPHRFVLQQRIAQAKRLLAGDDVPIASIGRGLGFRTPSHFANVFHRMTGVTPSAYRAHPGQWPDQPCAILAESSSDPAVAGRAQRSQAAGRNQDRMANGGRSS